MLAQHLAMLLSWSNYTPGRRYMFETVLSRAVLNLVEGQCLAVSGVCCFWDLHLSSECGRSNYSLWDQLSDLILLEYLYAGCTESCGVATIIRGSNFRLQCRACRNLCMAIH
jgi:hypothetical protein